MKLAQRLSDYLEIAKKGLILKNILDGLERGRETSDEDKSNRKNLKLVVNNVSSQVQDEHAPLNEQPNGIDIELAIKNELDQHMPIEHSRKDDKAVLIYLRRSGKLGKSVWGVSLWQLALAIAAGLEDGCITKDTELIIISEDDVLRTNELNPGLSRAMSRIRAGGVSVFIEASTIRGTSRRVVHNTLEVICEEAVTNTKVISAAQSSDSKVIRMMHAEKEQKRQLALANRNDNFHETDDRIRSKLSDSSPALYRLSVFLSTMSRTNMRSSQYLFKKELAAAKELEKKRAEQRTEKYAAELATAKKWQCKKCNLSIGMNEKRCICLRWLGGSMSEANRIMRVLARPSLEQKFLAQLEKDRAARKECMQKVRQLMRKHI